MTVLEVATHDGLVKTYDDAVTPRLGRRRLIVRDDQGKVVDRIDRAAIRAMVWEPLDDLEDDEP